MKRKLTFAVLLSTLCFTHQSIAAELPLLPDSKTAQTAYKEQDYTTAARHWMKLAHEGDAQSQTNLGKLYARGQGVETDRRTALNLFSEAAKQGDSKAMFELGRGYEKGYGVDKNIEKAKEWYDLSYQAGYSRAGVAYNALNGVESSVKPKPPRKKYRITNDIRFQFTAEDNLDLDTDGDQFETSGIINARGGVFLYPTDDITTFVEGRAFLSDGLASSNNDDDDDSADLNFLELRQAWIEFDNIAGHQPASAKIGRQRFREERGLWWNRDLDAARLSYDTSLTKAFVAVGQNQSQYRLGDDDEFDRDEEDRLRFLSEVSHQYKKDQFIEARFLYEDDNSRTENIGQNVDNDDRDDEDFSLAWVGVRAKGKHLLFADSVPQVSYRVDVIGLTGEITEVSTTAGPSSDLRTVNGVNTRDVNAFAFDGSIDIETAAPLSPTITLGYAYGSGDDGTGDSRTFRQSGLDGNSSRFPSGKVSNNLRNYGEVLRPELSNIHILNAGVAFPVMRASDFSLNYFSYWLDDEEGPLEDEDITAPLNGRDSHIGQALDASLNINLGKELKRSERYLKDTALRLRLGSFKSGDAFGDAEGDYALRGSSELRVKF